MKAYVWMLLMICGSSAFAAETPRPLGPLVDCGKDKYLTTLPAMQGFESKVVIAGKKGDEAGLLVFEGNRGFFCPMPPNQREGSMANLRLQFDVEPGVNQFVSARRNKNQLNGPNSRKEPAPTPTIDVACMTYLGEESKSTLAAAIAPQIAIITSNDQGYMEGNKARLDLIAGIQTHKDPHAFELYRGQIKQKETADAVLERLHTCQQVGAPNVVDAANAGIQLISPYSTAAEAGLRDVNKTNRAQP
jgi:hypothetical protein